MERPWVSVRARASAGTKIPATGCGHRIVPGTPKSSQSNPHPAEQGVGSQSTKMTVHTGSDRPRCSAKAGVCLTRYTSVRAQPPRHATSRCLPELPCAHSLPHTQPRRAMAHQRHSKASRSKAGEVGAVGAVGAVNVGAATTNASSSVVELPSSSVATLLVAGVEGVTAESRRRRRLWSCTRRAVATSAVAAVRCSTRRARGGLGVLLRERRAPVDRGMLGR